MYVIYIFLNTYIIFRYYRFWLYIELYCIRVSSALCSSGVKGMDSYFVSPGWSLWLHHLIKTSIIAWLESNIRILISWNSMHNIFFAYSWHTRCALLIHIRPHSGHIGHLRDSNDVTSQNGKLYSVRTLASKPRSFVRDFVTNHYQLNDNFGGFLKGRAEADWNGCFCSDLPMAWYFMAQNFIHDHSMSLFNYSLSITLFDLQPSRKLIAKQARFFDGQLRFAVVHWRIRRKWSDGSYHCFRPWVARQKGLKIQLQASRWSFWSLLCVVCFVLRLPFIFFFFLFFWLLRCSHFFFFQLSLLFLHFYWFSSYVFFLSCCCCCCYGCWWHIYLAVMPTVCCRFDRVCKGQWTRRPKRTSSLVSLFLSLTHGHCVVTLVVVGLCWLWQFCSFKVLPRICIFPVPNGV